MVHNSLHVFTVQTSQISLSVPLDNIIALTCRHRVVHIAVFATYTHVHLISKVLPEGFADDAIQQEVHREIQRLRNVGESDSNAEPEVRRNFLPRSTGDDITEEAEKH